MLGINCLVNRWQLRDELKDLVELHGLELIAEDKAPTIQAVYNSLRLAGFEIDAQTTGELYRDTNSFKKGDFYSTDDEIDAFTDKTYIDLFAAEAEENKEKRIGKDNPVVFTVASLMNGVKLMGEQTPTLQRIFQDRLLKAAKRVTGFKGEHIPANATAEQILKEAFTIEKHNPFGTGFSEMENAELLWREFKKEFAEVADVLEQKGDVYNADKIRSYADILEKATYKLMLSGAEVQKIISETLREAGFKKEVKSGGTVREIVDWNKIFNKTDFNFRETIKDVFRPKGFSEKELSRIADEMEDEYKKLRAAKLEASLRNANKGATRTEQKSAVHRLQQLYQYGIFSSSNMQALFRALKVKPTTAKQIEVLHRLMEVNNQALANNVSNFSPTYIKSIQREIEIIIEHSEEDRSGMLKAVRAYSFYNQFANALILSNAQNITENTLSGIFQLFSTMLFTQPKEAIETLKVVARVAGDVAQGGVREGQEISNSFNTSANAEERFNFETAKTPGQKILAGINLMPRVMMSVADNSIKAGLVHQMGIDMLKRELKRQGLSSEEANLVINEAFYGNRAEIEKIAKGLESDLVDSGVKVAKGKWKRIAAELSWSNMATDGGFFEELIKKLESAGDIGKHIEMSSTLVKDIRDAAEIAASKGLGHQADSKIMEFLDRIPSFFSRQVQEKRTQGRGLEGAELQRALYSQANKFRYGALRWTWLTLEKSTGLALLQTLITDVLLAKARGKQSGILNRYSSIDIDIDENDNAAVKRRAEELAWYASLKQRLIREVMGPLVGYLALRAVQALFSGSGSDDDKKRHLRNLAVAMRKDSMINRWYQKLLSARAYNYLSELAWVDRGEIKKKKISDITLPDELDAFEVAAGLNELLPTLKNNYNNSEVSKIIDTFVKWKQIGADKASGKLGEALVGVFFTSPFKIFDVQTGPFKSNPMLSSGDYKKLTPKNFWDGALKGFIDKQSWRNIQEQGGW